MTKELFLQLPMPPSVNSYYENRTVKRTDGSEYNARKITQAGKDFRDLCETLIYQQTGAFRCPAIERWITKAVNIEAGVVFHPPDNRQRDIDNPHKALWDALQACQIFANDKQIKISHTYMGEVVEGGLCRIHLREINDWKPTKKPKEIIKW